MTIENAKVLQERLADEAIAQVQVQGSKELADACIHSIGIVGKAWGIPADETANRQTRALEEQTPRVGGVGAREDAADSGTRPSAPDMAKKAMQTVWDLFETALDLDDDADRYGRRSIACSSCWPNAVQSSALQTTAVIMPGCFGTASWQNAGGAPGC